MPEHVAAPLRVIVASRNPVKVAAVRAAFETRFPGREIELRPLSVPSGVSDQPMSDSETHRGARNRVERARQAEPEADFWVGLEGGLEYVAGRLLASAWMAVGDSGGRISEARTPTLPLPPGVQALVEQGLELGAANDRVFATHNSKQAGGAFGLLTEGRYTREGVYTQTLELALVPFVNALWRDP